MQVDATGRVLELLLLLEAFWADPALGPNLQRNYTLAYLTPVSRSTVASPPHPPHPTTHRVIHPSHPSESSFRVILPSHP